MLDDEYIHHYWIKVCILVKQKKKAFYLFQKIDVFEENSTFYRKFVVKIWAYVYTRAAIIKPAANMYSCSVCIV